MHHAEPEMDNETLNAVRGCLAICLYDIIFAPADDYAAELTARKLMTNGTVITDPENVPAMISLALQAPVGLLESFDLPHERVAIVHYLEHLRTTLVSLLASSKLVH